MLQLLHELFHLLLAGAAGWGLGWGWGPGAGGGGWGLGRGRGRGLGRVWGWRAGRGLGRRGWGLGAGGPGPGGRGGGWGWGTGAGAGGWDGDWGAKISPLHVTCVSLPSMSMCFSCFTNCSTCSWLYGPKPPAQLPVQAAMPAEGAHWGLRAAGYGGRGLGAGGWGAGAGRAGRGLGLGDGGGGWGLGLGTGRQHIRVYTMSMCFSCFGRGLQMGAGTGHWGAKISPLHVTYVSYTKHVHVLQLLHDCSTCSWLYGPKPPAPLPVEAGPAEADPATPAGPVPPLLPSKQLDKPKQILQPPAGAYWGLRAGGGGWGLGARDGGLGGRGSGPCTGGGAGAGGRGWGLGGHKPKSVGPKLGWGWGWGLGAVCGGREGGGWGLGHGCDTPATHANASRTLRERLRTLANACERLRTLRGRFANALATIPGQPLDPWTPTFKTGTLLLRIRENGGKISARS